MRADPSPSSPSPSCLASLASSLILLASALSPVAHAVECYKCDPLASSDVDCTSAEQASTIICSKAASCFVKKFKQNSKDLEMRGCLYGGDYGTRQGCTQEPGEDPPFELCICQGDLCNGSDGSGEGVAESEKIKSGAATTAAATAVATAAAVLLAFALHP